MGEDIFCQLYNNWKKDGRIVFENKHVYSILSVTPALPLHSIIITKRHVEDGSELTGEEALGLFLGVKGTFEELKKMKEEKIIGFYNSLKQNPPTRDSAELAEAILKDPLLFDKPIAYNAGINMGKGAGQLVNHFHIHLFPVTKQGLGIVSAVRNHYRKQ